MNRAALVALALSGCYQPGIENNCAVRCSSDSQCTDGFRCEAGLCRDPDGQACSEPGTVDAALDDAMPVDAAIPANCWGAVPHQFCQMPAPTGMIDIFEATSFDTDNDPRCAMLVSSAVCVIAAQSILIRAPVKGHGSKPLMFVATNDLTITGSGEVDVSALGPSLGGPGAGGSGCTGGAPGLMGVSSWGGGAGGTFAGLGGYGGVADGGGGGQPIMTVTPNPSTIRGGCSGTEGGGPNGGAKAGGGGGAIILIAGTNLIVAGNVLARGGPGSGGTLAAGGAGGGSGGLIVLDGTTVNVSSSLIAGGGGGGGGGSSDGPGDAGGVAPITGGTAGGGAGAPSAAAENGGDGGGGSGQVLMPLNGEAGDFGGMLAGGGGGGGGAGVIQIRGLFTNQGATIAPPRT